MHKFNATSCNFSVTASELTDVIHHTVKCGNFHLWNHGTFQILIFTLGMLKLYQVICPKTLMPSSKDSEMAYRLKVFDH